MKTKKETMSEAQRIMALEAALFMAESLTVGPETEDLRAAISLCQDEMESFLQKAERQSSFGGGQFVRFLQLQKESCDMLAESPAIFGLQL